MHSTNIYEGFEYNETAIGAVTKTAYYTGSKADAAFVTITTSFNATNDIVPGDIIGKVTYSLPIGTSVMLYGKTSGLTSGTIKSTNTTVNNGTKILYNQTEANYSSGGGDSGGPIFISDSSGHFAIAGIHHGRTSSYGVFSKYSNIASELGIIAKTN